MRSSCERRVELERLDALRDELGMARHGSDAQAGGAGDGGQLAQEVAHVRLVTGALAPQHVGIDDDEVRHVSSRHSASTRSAAWCQVNPRARSSPSGTSSSRRASASAMPGRDRLRIGGVDEDGRAARHLLGGAAAARHDRRAAGHRLQHRDAEALVERRVDEAARAAVERRQLLVRRAADPAWDVDAAPSPAHRPTRSSTPAIRAASTAAPRFLRGSSVPTART